MTCEVMAGMPDLPRLLAMSIASYVPERPVGELLREWRERRRLSQLQLSADSGVSTRHLSWVETGRSRPTRQMILRLCEHLDVPLRARNTLLLAGGHAPAYPVSALDSPRMHGVLDAVRRLLDSHQPYPAVLVDAGWELVDANPPTALLTEGAADFLLEPPVNVLRLSLHPRGMAPRIRNLDQWRAHLFERLQRQAAATGSPQLAELLAELRGYPGGTDPGGVDGDVVVPLRYAARGHELALLSTTSIFGTPHDVTVAELAVESFFPADAATAGALRQLAESDG
jgi:transcriptional regulator with XRE-family HTH domain